MLEPESRHLLLDSLRPPAGYELDRAFGTTYSLDLAALLTAPVAFALIDRERADGAPVTDPVRLLEAVRRYAERIDIFCQAGLIGLPGQYQPIVSYLESTVHEVEAPTPGGIFHPKVWVIRFRQEEGDDLHYRLLCLSRNLTFDRSWDTVLRLEGTPGQRDEVSEPLATFLEQLPGRCREPLPDTTEGEVRQMADELQSVTFQPPPGIDRLRFWPLGLGTSWPFDSRIDRMLVVSPFLTAGCLERLNRKGVADRDVLISRLESLDRLGATALTRFAETLALHSGTETAEAEGERQQTPQVEAAAERPGVELRGLHAKLYVADAGWRAKVWTGSANATDAAFGRNVEFMVELEGRKDRCGVDAFLSRGQDGLALRDLLESYRPVSDDPLPETAEGRLERRLDLARRELASFEFQARVSADGERFSVQLSGTRRRPPAGDPDWPSITVRCRPLTMTAAYGKPVDATANEIEVDFGSTSFEALTSFFAFELESREEKATLSVGFLLNAKLIGAPTDRRERILVNLLKNRADLLRFLMFLLGGDTREGALLELGPDIFNAVPNGDGGREVQWQNLFEPMVRALAHDPRKLDEIGRLVRDLQLTEEGRGLLPDDWATIWEPIWSVRQGMAEQ